MGTSVGTVKSQTSHALARLRGLAPELPSRDGGAVVTRLTEALEDIAGQAKLYDVTDAAIRGANGAGGSGRSRPLALASSGGCAP